VADLEGEYAGRGYGDLKGDTADLVVETIRPIRERVNDYLQDPAELHRLMSIGAHKARTVAADTLDEVYQRVGFVPLDRE
jgi:tryptophanyl-tRNA synthetase